MKETSSDRQASRAQAAPRSSEFRSILVPIDLTPGSDRVLARLSFLPLASDARVTLLHVVPESLPRADQLVAIRDAKKALAEDVGHLRQHIRKKVEIEQLVEVGSAASQIAQCAHHSRAELTVMGRGGGRVLHDVFLGSTAERVIRQSKRPVLVVRRPARAAYRRPALALDLDQAAHPIICLMLRLLPLSRPHVDVIHAFNAYRTAMYPSVSVDEAEELRGHATDALAGLLAAACAKANVAPERAPIWRKRVRHGSPRLVVESAIKKAESDLLVVGTRGHSGLAHVFLGSVAGDLMRAAQCDVLIVPPTRA
jgi:nucleotide-binding universal stress UspA family protein